MLTKARQYWKAGLAFAGTVAGIWTWIAADDAIGFDEIGPGWTALAAAFAALVTAVGPRNKEV